MKTRKQRLNNEVSHREYYSQFVNEDVKARVCAVIGLDALLKSKDEHLNDIPMKKWDSMAGFVWRIIGGQEVAVQKPRTNLDILPVDARLLVDGAEDSISCATLVCIYKEAGKQIIEEHRRD